MASAILDTISHNRAMQLAYIDIYKAETDKISKIAYATKRGAKDKALSIAKYFLSQNIPISMIIEGTGLSEEELK